MSENTNTENQNSTNGEQPKDATQPVAPVVDETTPALSDAEAAEAKRSEELRNSPEFKLEVEQVISARIGRETAKTTEALKKASELEFKLADERSLRTTLENELNTIKAEAMLQRVALETSTPLSVVQSLRGDTEEEIKENLKKVREAASAKGSTTPAKDANPLGFSGKSHASSDGSGMSAILKNAMKEYT